MEEKFPLSKMRNSEELIKNLYKKLAQAANTEANKINNFIKIKN